MSLIANLIQKYPASATQQTAIATLDCVLVAISIDDSVEPAEEQDLADTVSSLEAFAQLGDDELNELVNNRCQRLSDEADISVSLARISQSLSSREHRVRALALATAVSTADDNIGEAELSLLGAMAQHFDIAEEEKNQLLASVADEIDALS